MFACAFVTFIASEIGISGGVTGQMKNKVYYKRVDRSYFFPEDDPGRYDFLN